MIGNVIGIIIFGAVIGVLARLVLPGKQNISAVMTVALGWIRDIISVIVAAGAIVAYGAVTGRKTT